MGHTDESHRLKLFMEREGLTREDIALLLPRRKGAKEKTLDPSQVSRYISGSAKVPLELVKILHIKYGLSYSWFFHGTGTMKVKEKEQRKLMNDITDVLATLGVIMQSQEAMRDDFNRLARDFYAGKHGVN